MDGAKDVIEELLKEEARRVEHAVTVEALTSIPRFNPINTFKYEKPEDDVDGLMSVEWGSVELEVGVERDWKSGQILSFREKGGGEDALGPLSSLSLRRPPGDPSLGLMASSSNLPFLPGGMETDLFRLLDEVETDGARLETDDINPSTENLLSVAPGLDRGLDLCPGPSLESAGEAIQEEHTDKTEPSAIADDDFMSMMDLISTPGLVISDRDDKEIEQDPPTPVEAADSPLAAEDEKLEKDVIESGKSKKKLERKPKIQVEQKPEFAVTLNTQSYVPGFDQLVPSPAKKWPFKLDPFQEQAVLCLERGDSVFVAAHTSAGKTVVAEYAVALCQKHLTRAVYTSPIKALSNQKFREFKMGFEDVGLITGDIQIHPEAFCLIMTTEILRSMLYNGSELIRELEWVIFDEVHYINDSERGVVWEEVLIMLPSHIKIVMLSATVPNTLEFADWVGRIKNRKVYVMSTAKRPVPLEHFLYTGTDGKTKENRFLIVDKNGQFLQHNYKLACESRAPKKGTNARSSQGFNPKGDRNILITLINHLSTKELLPVVAFTFSRKRCDENAASLTSVDLTTSMEKTEIHFFFSRCIKQLKGTDKKLPQVMQMQELCKRGIAVHHSGILPLLKEVVELLFQQGFVKVLFATETFAMGVNMPARTVVFDSMQKHDGTRKRDLNPGEYVQMAGRAGRRGLDSTGTVILLSKWGPVPEMSDLHRMMLGKPTKLESKFRVTYSMLLNLLRVEELRIEDMLKRSFVESNSQKSVMTRRDDLKSLSKSLRETDPLDCKICEEGNLANFYQVVLDLARNSAHLWSSLNEFGFLSKLLVPGRLILVSCGPQIRNRVSILLRVSSGTDRGEKVLSVLVPMEPSEDPLEPGKQNLDEELEARAWDLASNNSVTAPALSAGFHFQILELSSKFMTGILTKTQKMNASAIFEDEEKRKMPRFKKDEPEKCITAPLRELMVQCKSDVSLVNIAKDIVCNDIDLFTRIQSVAEQLRKLPNYSCIHCLNFKDHFVRTQELNRLQHKKKELEFSLSSKNLLLLPEYKKKLKVLRSLGYVDDSNMVELKGKVACEIHQEELLVTELILNNVIGDLSPPEIAALLSCTTCQFRDKDVSLSPHMLTLKGKVIEIATKISVRQRECELLDGDPTEYLRFDLMEVVYEWARGMPFGQIMEMTSAQEGIIVRCIQRLDEVCKDVRNGARIVGDPNLQYKMEETSVAIKRDIVFAASLYTSNNVFDRPHST